jgi:hypothetical protein
MLIKKELRRECYTYEEIEEKLYCKSTIQRQVSSYKKDLKLSVFRTESQEELSRKITRLQKSLPDFREFYHESGGASKRPLHGSSSIFTPTFRSSGEDEEPLFNTPTFRQLWRITEDLLVYAIVIAILKRFGIL